jgi:hypothetical protein
MSPRGAVALGEIAGTLAMLEVGCAWRKRHGRFSASGGDDRSSRPRSPNRRSGTRKPEASRQRGCHF